MEMALSLSLTKANGTRGFVVSVGRAGNVCTVDIQRFLVIFSLGRAILVSAGAALIRPQTQSATLLNSILLNSSGPDPTPCPIAAPDEDASLQPGSPPGLVRGK